MSPTVLICELLLVISSLFFLIKLRDLFHPSVIVSLLWTVILLAYNHYPHNMYAMSENLCALYTSWAFLFSTFSYLTSKLRFYGPKFLRIKVEDLHIGNKFFYAVCLVNIILIYFLLKQAGGNELEELANLRKETVDEGLPPHIKMLYYVNQYTIIYFLGLVYFAKDKTPLKKIILLGSILLVTLILKTNKTGFIILFIGILFILHKKRVLTVKRALLSGAGLVGLLVAVTVVRGDTAYKSFNWSDHILIYLLSPIPAMDLLYNDQLTIHPGSWGSVTFKFFYTIFGMLGGNYTTTTGGSWVSVPLPTNVYTVIKPYYLDFGTIGVIVFAMILGCIWGSLYSMQRRNYPVYVLFYAVMLYSLYVQFFSDYFFGFFSVTLQSIIFAWIVCVQLSGAKFFKLKHS